MNEIIFEELFEQSNSMPFTYKGKEVFLSDKLILNSKNQKIRIERISTNSKWIQGIGLEINKGNIEISNLNNQTIKTGTVLWENTTPKIVEITINSNDYKLYIFNVWNKGDRTLQYGHNGAAMYCEITGNKTTYYCNDGYPDDDFDDLVFSVEYL